MKRPSFANAAGTPDRIYWACVAGLLAWALLRWLGVDRDAAPILFGPFLGVMALAAANLAVRSFVSRRRDRHESAARFYRRIGWVFVSIDFISIALGLRFTGGLHSAIWVISFVVIAGETVLESRREATITRAAACGAILLGTLPTDYTRFDAGAYTLEMFVRMGLLIAVSSVMRRLRERSEQVMAEVASLRSELALADQRAGLAREIHDGVGNSLAAAVLRLEMSARVRHKEAPSDESTVAMLKDEAQNLRQAMAAVRDWTFFTRPWPTDTGQPPSSVLIAEVERLSRRTGLPIRIEGADALDGVPERARLALLRIAQEALTNAAKHAAGATEAIVRLSREGSTLTMAIEDDGAGFDTNQMASGIGMSSMRERALGIGAQLSVDSAAGTGSRVTVRIRL